MSLDLKIYRQASDVHLCIDLYSVSQVGVLCISLQNTEDPHLTVTLSIYSSHQPAKPKWS